MELSEQIRREYDFGVETMKGVAAHFGGHRRLGRQAIVSAAPQERAYRSRACPAIEVVKPFADAVPEADQRAQSVWVADVLAPAGRWVVRASGRF